MTHVAVRVSMVFLGAILLLAFTQPILAQEPVLAITGVTVIDGTGASPQEATTILVRDGRIAAVTPDGEANVSEGARSINATGNYVVLGFADMHEHFNTGGSVPLDSAAVQRVLRQFFFYDVTQGYMPLLSKAQCIAHVRPDTCQTG